MKKKQAFLQNNVVFFQKTFQKYDKFGKTQKNV